MTELPCGIKSITVRHGLLNGWRLQSLPDNIAIVASWNVNLENLVSVGNNVYIRAGWTVFLNKLTTICNISIVADDSIHLESPITMGNNVFIKSGDSVWLEHLINIGNNVVIETGNNVYFKNNKTGLKEISLIDGETVSNAVIRFLLENDIHLQIPKVSSLVNLISDGVKVEIIS